MCSFYLQLPHFFISQKHDRISICKVYPPGRTLHTFVFKAKKKKQNRLLPNLQPSQNVLKYSLFKLRKFHEKIDGRFFARGHNT